MSDFWRGFRRGFHRGVYVAGRVVVALIVMPLFLADALWQWAQYVAWAVGACFRTEDE